MKLERKRTCRIVGSLDVRDTTRLCIIESAGVLSR